MRFQGQFVELCMEVHYEMRTRPYRPGLFWSADKGGARRGGAAALGSPYTGKLAKIYDF